MPPSVPRRALPNVVQALQEALSLHQQGKLSQAEKLYTRILKAHRDHFDALHLLGMLKHQSGKTGEAFRLISAALEVNPNSADALSNLGLVLHALKRDADALASFDKALAIDPGHIEALNNRGTALLNLERSQDALACFDKILALSPRHAQALVNRGNALLELGRGEEAIAAYGSLLAIHPAHPGALFNRGNALMSLDRHAEAIAAYDKLLAIVPPHAKAWNNRGFALRALNRHTEALASYGRAVAIQKDYADAHVNEAYALLTLGELRRGFETYEWRWKSAAMAAPRRTAGQPLWTGSQPLHRKTILIHAEQGFGDAIQFVRYAPLLARGGARVILEVPPELVKVLSGVDGVTSVIARGEPLPAYDVHCPLVSLPFAFKTELATIPADLPYVRAGADCIARWRPRIERLDRPRIALAWSGRVTHANDRNRSIALSRFTDLLSIDGACFVSIQRDVRETDAALLRADPRIAHLGDDLDDFADTAAVISLVDLVISVDSAVGHLAAAMARPVWILLPFSPDWRWLLARPDSPWYPTARLFRQPSLGDWASVIARMKAELTGMISGEAPAAPRDETAPPRST